MKLTVNFFRGIKQAVIKFTPITLVASRNHQGKSSIVMALAALLTGQVLPSWLLKKHATAIVNDSSGTGQISITTEDGSVSIDYPAASMSSSGTPPRSSRVAVGIESPVNMVDKERSHFLSNLLKTEATEKDLRDAVAGAGLPDDQFQALWRIVQTTGWDSAHETIVDKGKFLKGEWKGASGEIWGSQKAQSWSPQGWVPRLNDMTPEGIQSDIDRLKGERDETTRKDAIDEVEIARLKPLADGLSTAEATHEDNCALVDKRMAELKKVTGNGPPELVTMSDQVCPHCGEPLNIKGGKIVVGSEVRQSDVTKSEKARKQYEDAVTVAQDALDSVRDDSRKSLALVNECKAAKSQFDAIKDQATDTSGRDVNLIDAEIDQLEADRDMILIKAKAAQIHKNIEKNVYIVAALAADGVRKTVLERGLKPFNKSLAQISETAKWAVVEFTEDLEVTLGGRHYMLLSESEQYRVRATIQIAAAKLDGSNVLVFDRADILDGAGRQGLGRAIITSEIPAVVCMTYSKREDVPDMSQLGGETLWVENGEVVE